MYSTVSKEEYTLKLSDINVVNFDYHQGDQIWIASSKSDESDIPKGATIYRVDTKKIQVQFIDGTIDWVTPERILKPIHASQKGPVDDMIHLLDLQEHAILHNLHLRYKNQTIYTYIGDMLIAVNPYQALNIYSTDHVVAYSEKRAAGKTPHIFATSDKCFTAMKSTRQSQCILISGESGAGKTESTKLILQYLTAISAGGHSWIKQQILETNPILEAFGNAKTQKNDNSSRFGKYININFNKNGEIEGARIDYYLLEKSRIVTQSKNERNYHIFYAILAGLASEEKQKLYLDSATDYKYLKGTNTYKDRNDAKTLADVKAAMQVINSNKELFPNIVKLIALILHLGNLKFKSTTIAHADASEIHDSIALKCSSEFFGVPEKNLSDLLTKKSIYAKGEKVVSYLPKNRAIDVRDSLAKLVYEKVFEKLLSEINVAINKTKTRAPTIGILDISGFENFDSNSFEQLCINYANEHLQQYVVQHIFKMEQERYASEGISWTNIDFADNHEIIDLIGVKPLNVMSLIDEETIYPKGTDASLLSKLALIHGTDEHFIKPKSNLKKEFGITHFAGVVMYDIAGFLDKNRDVFTGDFKRLIASSANSFLKELFSPNELVFNSDISNKRSPTISVKFRESLDSLLSTLHSCNPFFIRCIKPNETRQPQIFDRMLCYRQLRYSGLLDTVKIRSAGYPVRYDYDEFAEHFRALVRNIDSVNRNDKKAMTEKICSRFLNIAEHSYQFGYSKVFLKDYQNEILEKEKIEALKAHALVIQKSLRMWVVRKRFLNIRNAAIIIQKTWRGYGPRKKFHILHHAVLRLQSRIRSRYHATEFQRQRKFIISLQAVCRRHLVRKACEEKRQLKLLKQKESLQNSLRNSLKQTKKLSRESGQNIDHIFNFLDQETQSINSRKLHPDSHDINGLEFTEINHLGLADELDESEITSYDFYKFAAIYFTGNATPHYSKKPLKQSLLDLPHLSDQLAARALSITIFRFMGDLSEPEYPEYRHSNKTVMNTITESLTKNYKRTDSYSKMMTEENQHFLRMTLKKKNKLNNIITQGIINDEYESWLNTERNNIEKLQFIVGHGILRPELKDEIYCQIVKQLINNPSKASYAKGWVLLSLCIGCFAPSEKFINYFKSFIKTGPPDYALFCERRLMRTYRNGSRTQPPCWIEMQSVKYKEPVLLNVSITDGTVKRAIADSASTAQEIVQSLAGNINLKDTFGFSLFITIDDKVMSLGSEGEHIMDAISQCEQYVIEQGRSERDAQWHFLLRKEVFSPWHHSALDPVSTNLIYHQLCKGIKLGEYKCPNEHDVATIIAQQLFVQCRSKSIPKNVRSTLRNYIPTHFLQGSNPQFLTMLEKLTIEVYQKKFNNIENNTVAKTKDDIVTYAKDTWPLLFSKFYEANKIFGPDLNSSEIIIAVNSTGVYFIDNKERVLQHFSFAEIAEVSYQKNENSFLHNLTISTMQRDEFIFQSVNAESFVYLVNYIIDGLKQRSPYVVAIQDYITERDETFLPLRKGDVIKLTDDCTGNTVLALPWGTGQKNGVQGKFPCEYVYVLPTLEKPSSQLIEIFKGDFPSKNLIVQELNKTLKESKYYTLKKFASEHFRLGMKASKAFGSSESSAIEDKLWKHTCEPIKAPLLAKLSNADEQFFEAIEIFTNILRYMGDLPTNKQGINTELTDRIFEPPLKDELLRDEVYCQIMRQITGNTIRLSEERGWELMWLATGIMPCRTLVRKELEQFLNSRDSEIAKECLSRFNRIVKLGSRRIYPPYILELEAVRFKNLKIFHKIYFPDGTDAAFEVHSSTRALDISTEISRKLELQGHKGFSLYLKNSDRRISVPEYYFFFDFIREFVNWVTRLRQRYPEMETKYQVLFLRKIWINCLPGRDRKADSKFHFYQEALQFLRGHHKCSKQDAVELATFIYISGHGDNKEELSQIHLKLQEYVPTDMKTIMSPKEWKKRITAAYNSKKGMSQDEAKEKFLQRVYQWPTFGSAFFDVLQTTEPKFPANVTISINKNGVSIINRSTKGVLAMYSFAEISRWSSGDAYFVMTIGDLMKGQRILCQTALGYKMDDLISSYINYLQGGAGNSGQNQNL